MPHGTGHGIGLDIHEPPLLDRAGPALVEGDALTITEINGAPVVGGQVITLASGALLTINADGTSPDIDLASTFSIGDVGAARRYIPRKVMKPKLYNWFQGALVAGSIERGTVRLDGPLDKFPFDNDEGRFLIEGSARNLTFKYQPNWPAAEQADIALRDAMAAFNISSDAGAEAYPGWGGYGAGKAALDRNSNHLLGIRARVD